MQTYDIPVNIQVYAETESEAERIVTEHLNKLLEKPALERNISNWDFIEFVTEEEFNNGV